MKVRYVIVYAALGVAFLAVSLWVTLSGGKNARAVRAKYHLGGLMLTVASMLSVSSCGGILGGDEVMCYDPAPPRYITVAIPGTAQHVKVGDVIELTVKDCPFKGLRYDLRTTDTVIQNGELGDGDGVYQVTIKPIDYHGELCLTVLGISDDGKEVFVGEEHFILD